MAQFIKVGEVFINLDNVNNIRFGVNDNRMNEATVYFTTAVTNGYDEDYPHTIAEERECFVGEEADALEAYLNRNSTNVVRQYQQPGPSISEARSYGVDVDVP